MIDVKLRGKTITYTHLNANKKVRASKDDTLSVEFVITSIMLLQKILVFKIKTNNIAN
jgi:hypothetical protein